MTQTLIGPGGIRLVLDATEVYPDDPGQGTPAMVYVGRHAGTFFCAIDTGEIGCGDYQLSAAQVAWLERQWDAVDALLDAHTN